MQILVHIGFNKCASSFIQRSLAGAQAQLRRHGVFYAVEGERAAHYGLSRHYGFGPDAAGLTPRSLAWLASEAERRGCGRMVLSSEYLSLNRPKAIAAFWRDVEMLGADARVLVFSRDVQFWLRSLFNQYVKTVDGPPHFASLDAFVTHVLKNGAIDISRRLGAWIDVAGAGRIAHHRIGADQASDSVLRPFGEFSGMSIPPAAERANRSLPAGALYLTGLLRQARPGAQRDRLLTRVANGEFDRVPVPEDFLAISPTNLDRLEAEIARPFAELTGGLAAERDRLVTAA